MRNLLLGIPASLILLFTSGEARADHPPPGRATVHVHTSHCAHAPAPPSERGRYELRPVDKWVEGYWAERYVPGKCVQKKRWTKCKDGQTVREFVPGRYERVQEWVWIPAPAPRWSVSMRF